ncbi:E3 ubiquitin-protein ligase RNF144A isoform X1 [Rousettus aegyptiacus]|uniref:E3 ubiquitin-protein ligase RNF144A isoform X1 n=1 Tax=Rousettus aegyptiacus TaxID=9407 RepID=UPI00168CCFED|nr:E3 ubiquitin-protein ligase RNF144A isoform X1 [Rousettus aegyptiacus]XP_036079995.1 E3 ubiquitin-protein ligase RNF144A isoform X1 [Rousettus aegyptiacus]
MHVPRILKPSYSSWMWRSGLLSLLFLFVFILRTSHWPPASLTDSALGFPRLWGNLTQAFFVTVFSFWHFPLFFKNPISLLCEPFTLALFSPSSVRTPDVRLAVILAPVCSFHRPRHTRAWLRARSGSRPGFPRPSPPPRCRRREPGPMHVLEGARARPSVRGSVSARPGAELSCVCDAGAAGGLGCRRGLPCPLPAGSAAGERVLGSRLLHGLVPLPVAVSRREPLAGPDSTGSGLNPCPEQARGPGPCSPLLRGHGEAGWGRARVSGGLKRGPLLQRPPGGVSTGCSFLVPSSGWNFLDFSLRDRRGGVGVPEGRPPNVCGSLQAAGPGILLFTRSSRKPSL